MPRSGGDAAPRDYVSRGSWPAAELRDEAPVSAVYGQAFAQRLAIALKGRGDLSLRAVEREAKVSRRTIERALSGDVLPDFGAIARLEEWLGVELWPGPEIRAQKQRRATRVENIDRGEGQT